MKQSYFKTLVASTVFALAQSASADNYQVDTEGAHAFIEFKIKHLGYSWLSGRFNKFDGRFSYDENKPAASTVNITIDTTSIDSNHAERDKHLRGKDFLNVSRFPKAQFTGQSFKSLGNGKATLTGQLTLHGVTKVIIIDVEGIGQGSDPWGGYRMGFEGKTTIALKDFGIDYDLGPASNKVQLHLGVEGIKL